MTHKEIVVGFALFMFLIMIGAIMFGPYPRPEEVAPQHGGHR